MCVPTFPNLFIRLKAHKMKTQRIFIRVSIETKNAIAKKAKEHGTTMSDYILTLLQNKKMKVQSLPDRYTLEIKKELSVIGKNLWSLIKYNKTLKLTEKINLERIILELKRTLEIINNYYDSQNHHRD
jgi:hypothetical protein